MVQALMVKKSLEEAGASVEIIEVTTKGDRDRVHALTAIGGKGLFVRGIEEKLLDGEADIAVHCGKDLPYELQDGLVIAGVPGAADARDMLLVPEEKAGAADMSGVPEEKACTADISDTRGLQAQAAIKTGAAARHEGFFLPQGAVIGTGSPRRRAELARLLPGARFQDIRGNITTRIRKMRDGEYDGIILAKAGVDRLGPDLSGLRVRIFSEEECIPAGCQGILAIECRSDDAEMRSLLETLTDAETKRRYDVERYLFCKMKADCSMAVGVHAHVEGDAVRIAAMLRGRKTARQGLYADFRAMCDDIARELTEG